MENCPNAEKCSAPLCPLDHPERYNWFPDEEICHKRDAPGWVRRQKAIVKAKALPDKYFTVAMLQAISQVRRGIEGVNPDQTLEEARKEEQRWIELHKTKRVVAKQTQEGVRVIAKEKGKAQRGYETSHGKELSKLHERKKEVKLVGVS